MVRTSGSLKVEKSLRGPTGEASSSVVRRKRGKSANRINGTESRPPTQTEPKASKAPRKERLSPEGSSGVENFFLHISTESSCLSLMKFSWLPGPWNCKKLLERDSAAR